MNTKNYIVHDFGILINKVTTNPNDPMFNDIEKFKIANDALDSTNVEESLDKISLGIEENIYELKIHGKISINSDIPRSEIPEIIIKVIEKNRSFISSSDYNNGIFYTELKINEIDDLDGKLELEITEDINKIRFKSNEVIIIDSEYYINNNEIRKVWFNDLSCL